MYFLLSWLVIVRMCGDVGSREDHAGDPPFAAAQRPNLFAGEDPFLAVQHGPEVTMRVPLHMPHIVGRRGSSECCFRHGFTSRNRRLVFCVFGRFVSVTSHSPASWLQTLVGSHIRTASMLMVTATEVPSGAVFGHHRHLLTVAGPDDQLLDDRCSYLIESPYTLYSVSIALPSDSSQIGI